MSVTDLDQLQEIQAVLQEDATFSNGIWSLTEVVAYFNQRQYRFLVETKCIAAFQTLGWVAGVPQQALPTDWIATIEAAWHDLATNLWTPLPRTDFFEMDHLTGPTGAVTVGFPQGFREADTVDTLSIGITPAPQAAGEVSLIYVALSDLLDGSGVLLGIPDDWVPYLKYGVLADMFSKEGRGRDLLRARYCEQRYQEGIVLAQVLLEGRS